MNRLKQTIEKTDTAAGRLFDMSVQLMIVISLITFPIETLPELTDSTKSVLRFIELICVAGFTTEYLLRVAVSSNRLKFATSFFGVIDLLAILPFYLALGIDLRAIRAFRLLRILRVLKLARYNRAVRRLRLAIQLATEELVLFLVVSSIVLYLAAVGIYYFENPAQPKVFESVFHSFWWAVVTLTTVGYGDMAPITAGGRLFTFVVLIVGLGLVSVPSALMASAVSKARKIQEEEEASINAM